MKFYESAKELLYMDAEKFIGSVPESEIKCAMQELSVTFPESYQAFLTDFGAGDIGREFIFGITKDEEENVVNITTMARIAGLPHHFVLISYLDNAFYCLDVSKMAGGECPVVKLSHEYEITETVAESFGHFLCREITKNLRRKL